MPPQSECRGAVSSCWTPGEADWDCPNNNLCCFDGCANTCLGSPPSSRPQPQTQPRPAVDQAAGGGDLYGASDVDYDDYSGSGDLDLAPVNRPPEEAGDYPDDAEGSAEGPSPQVGSGLLFPPPGIGYAEQQQPLPSPADSRPQRPRPSNVNQVRIAKVIVTSLRHLQGGEAAVKPYVRCPSAMECVQRTNCDFDGFITSDTLNLTPDLEMLRVPLIVSTEF